MGNGQWVMGNGEQGMRNAKGKVSHVLPAIGNGERAIACRRSFSLVGRLLLQYQQALLRITIEREERRNSRFQ